MDFSNELLARLEAAQLNSPPNASALAGGGRSPTAFTAPGAAAERAAATRRALWPGDLSCGGSSPSSSGRQTPRSCTGLLEALLTSDGSPQAAATARAAAAAALAATAAAPFAQYSAAAGGQAGWDELPADVWRWVVISLSPPDVKAARLVCADWHTALSNNVELLRPRQMRCRLAASRWAVFPWVALTEGKLPGVCGALLPAGGFDTLTRKRAADCHWLVASGGLHWFGTSRARHIPCTIPTRSLLHTCSFPSIQVLDLGHCRHLQVGWDERLSCHALC